MRVLGLMSGTSFDGVDASVVDFRYDGGVLHGRICWSGEFPMPPQGRDVISRVLDYKNASVEHLLTADRYVGRLFADCARQALELAGGADVVCSHGQTVYHWVERGVARASLQIGNPAWIAEATGLPVVADFRMRDIAAGGQGAPLVPFLDALLLAGRGERPAALNLGGIANVTVVDGGVVTAWDVGPANGLIDAVVATQNLNQWGYDRDAALASAGSVDQHLLAVLMADPYFAATPPKSTGKEYFNYDYVLRALRAAGQSPAPADLVATLTAFTIRSVARDLDAANVDYLAVSGGGARNPVIMAGLQEHLPRTKVVVSDDLGAPADAKEAILCSLIGWATMHNTAATLPGTTGAVAPRVLGTITPGAGALQVFPSPGPIRELRLSAEQ